MEWTLPSRKSTQWIVVSAIGFALSIDPLAAAEAVDKAYVQSLASPGKTVLVVQYYDGTGKVVSRKGFASAAGFRAISPTEIGVDDRTSLRLYGLETCGGEMVNRKEDFAGRCEDFAREQLATLLKSPKVILCRAFLSEEKAPRQNVTCFGYYNFPGSLDSIDNLEEELLSLGALRLIRKPDGTLMRQDLIEAEKVGQKGFGMWADPRHRQ